MLKSTLRFPRTERLKSRKRIGQLITGDSVSFIYPFRIAWMNRDLEGGYPLQIAFSVPKRRVRHAVDRNPIRRRMMESWRIQRQPLIDHLREKNIMCNLILIYSGKPEDADYRTINRSIARVIRGIMLNDLPPPRPSRQGNNQPAPGH